MKKEQANIGNTRILGWKVLLGASSAVPYFYVSLLFLALFSGRDLLSLPFNWLYGLFIFLLPAAMVHYIWFRSVAPELGSSETIKDLIRIHVMVAIAVIPYLLFLMLVPLAIFFPLPQEVFG